LNSLLLPDPKVDNLNEIFTKYYMFGEFDGFYQLALFLGTYALRVLKIN